MRAECEELACHYRRRCLSRAGEVPQKHREVLAELQRRRYRLAVLSNNDGYVEDRLIKEGIRDFFEAVFDSARVGLAKPDARLFALVEKHFHVGPGDCLYVGDDPAVDVVGAQGAGWAAAWLRTGREALAGSPRPDITLTSLEELLAHL
jgi:putative hydrolase of the HAD superfamily